MANFYLTPDTTRDSALSWWNNSGLGNMDKTAAADALMRMYAGSTADQFTPNYPGADFQGQSAYLTPETRLANDPTQFGNYVGTFGNDGKLNGVNWQQRDASGGWFSDNLDWLGPLIVGGAAMAGAGGLLPDFSQGANLSGSIGTTDLLGGAASDTLGGGAAAGAADSGFSLGALDQIPVVGGQAATDAAIAAATAAGAGGAGGGLLSGITSTLGGSNLGGIAGAALGALASGAAQGGTTTASKEPWGPTQDWLKGLIGQGQALQQQYTQTPFSAQQQAQYSNLFGDIANFRNAAPGLFSFSQNAMTNPGFQRQTREIQPMPTVSLPFAR